jgi:hypothetical protein
MEQGKIKEVRELNCELDDFSQGGRRNAGMRCAKTPNPARVGAQLLGVITSGKLPRSNCLRVIASG